MFQSAAVPTRASGGGSGRLGAADPTPATQTAAFSGLERSHTVFKTPASPIPDPSSFIWQNGEGQARKARPPAGARALAGATAGATLAGATLARATLEGARRGFFVLKILSYFLTGSKPNFSTFGLPIR